MEVALGPGCTWEGASYQELLGGEAGWGGSQNVLEEGAANAKTGVGG